MKTILVMGPAMGGLEQIYYKKKCFILKMTQNINL